MSRLEEKQREYKDYKMTGIALNKDLDMLDTLTQVDSQQLGE